jgi:hypothetical protein
MFGWSVALSASGDRALVTGPDDVFDYPYVGGAAWSFTRSGSVWSQEGPKFKMGGAGPYGGRFGYSLALSADGATALVGGPSDYIGYGTAWVLTRSGSTWSQQGPNLTGIDASECAKFGSSVALSADGNTAVVSGPDDNGGNDGAVWTFTRSGSSWAQQGSKLVGSKARGFGRSVALSADGNTSLGGGSVDEAGDYNGAAWVFTRTGSTWAQQGPPLSAGGAIYEPRLGSSIALSADGNTALVGGPGDGNWLGAAWVFTRTGTTWLQQGTKLTGAGGGFGWSVALSADGNTALVGAPIEGNWLGAAWVFTRSGSTWTQQGAKLTPADGVGVNVGFGSSVALSADGNTALVGGRYDSNWLGAAWVFTRSNSTWTQQGPKLTGGGATAYCQFGESVALSADGNTALAGALANDSGVGAVWAFTRSGSTWNQQGEKLTGGGETGAGNFGDSLALSADGNVALVGGSADDGGAGALWTFARSGSTWTQQGEKLTGGGQFGSSVALTPDGSTALVGGPADEGGVGAAWLFARSGSSWIQQGGKLIGGDETLAARFGSSVALSEDGATASVGGPGDNGEQGAAWVFVNEPASSAAPELSGGCLTGELVVATNGSWTGNPGTFAYQWERCDASGSRCSPIAGATASQYTMGDVDIGSRLRVVVTATSSGGSASAASAPTGIVPSGRADSPQVPLQLRPQVPDPPSPGPRPPVPAS